MTTKAQEREALKKIAGIIDSLGDGSYIGTAFEGCLRDAEDNIEDDAAYSMKQRYDSANEKIVNLQRELYESKKAEQEALARAEGAEAAAMDGALAATILTDYKNHRTDLQMELKYAADELVKLIGTATEEELSPYIRHISELKSKVASMTATIEKIAKYI